MKKRFRKLLSVSLAAAMTLCMIPAATTATRAETGSPPQILAQETVQGSAILHCWNWSFDEIRNHLSEIAAAGYTAVQTSPIQPPVDYSSAWTDTKGQWWKLYQPLDFAIPTEEGHSWLGTKAQLTQLCSEAESQYGIKVIVDVVANHLANNGNTDGIDGMSEAEEATLSTQAAQVWQDNFSTYFHQYTNHTNSDSRFNTTQYQMGMPDLNTGNSYVQQRVLGFLKECVDCGVDGFRFDAAKHIELPGESDSTHGAFGSNFWPTVIGGVEDYASSKGNELYIYSEILGYPGTDVKNYTKYMAVTDNETGNKALYNVRNNNAAGLASYSYYKGSEIEKYVLWAESHDTYNELAFKGYGTVPTDEEIVNTWAIVGARADSTALYFSRHNETMGLASSDDTWKSAPVAEVNKFKNVFNGQGEYLSSLGNTAYIERGTKGVVISKLDGAGPVRLNANKLVDGTYTDHVTGNTFTVSGSVISGTVGESGVAVVYNADDITDTTVASLPTTLYLDPGGAELWAKDDAHFAMYLYNNSTNSGLIQMLDGDSDSIYEASVPSGDWTKVIFVRLNPNGDIDWKNKWNQTEDLNLYRDGRDMFVVKDWGVYSWSTKTHTHPFAGQPTWAWSDNYSSAFAVLDNCSVCGKSYAQQATVTTSASGNIITYTATISYGGQTYTDIKTVENEVETVTLYLNTGGSNLWNQDDARFAMDFYNNDLVHSWVDMTLIDGDIYSGIVPAGNWTKVIFCRMDGSTTENNNNNRWNRTASLDIPDADGDTLYTVTGWGDDKCPGQWSAYTPAEPTEYTITWKNYDGSVITTTTVTEGTVPSYTDTTPTKPSDGVNNYTFSGWTPAITAASADAEYTAAFTATPVDSYTITWLNADGSTLATTTVSENGTPSYTGATPTKATDKVNFYTFSGWTPEIVPATEDTSYTAVYTTTPVHYWLVGSFNNWSESDNYAMVRNTETPSNVVEFMILGVQLTQGNELKIKSTLLNSKGKNVWFPGQDNVVISETGRYNVYVRPNNDGGRLFSTTNSEESVYVQPVYAVEFNSGGGSDVNAQFVDIDHGVASEPAAPAMTGYSFDGWYYGDEPYDFSSTVNEDIVLTAHWTENQVTITFTDNNNIDTPNTVGVMTEVADVMPKPAYLDGYNFEGWTINGGETRYMTQEALLEAVNAAIDPDNPQPVSIKVNYGKDNTRYLVTVEGGTLPQKTEGNPSKGMARVSDVIIAEANDPESGMKFDHWTKNGVIVGYDTTYKFRMPAEEVKLVANYVSSSTTVTPEGTAYIESVKSPATNKLAFVAVCSIPDIDGYEWIAGGVVATNKASVGNNVEIGNCDFYKVASVTNSTTRNLKYTWTKSKVSADDTWYVKPYVTYKDSAGTQHTIYGDVVTKKLQNGNVVING